MADYSESCREIKCRSLQRRRQPPLWVWCFLIACLLSLPSVFSKCNGLDFPISIYPPDPVRVTYGNPLELFCVAENYSVLDIQFFTIGEDLYPYSEVVNSTTRRLFIKKPEKQERMYACHNIKQTEKSCIANVLVGSLPTDVTDFNCISYNLENLKCSWTDFDLHHILSLDNPKYRINNYDSYPLCSKTYNSSSKKYCTWNSISSELKYTLVKEKQYFDITKCNFYGCNHQNFTIDQCSIVKPDPPYNLQVTENRPHTVDLMWSIPDKIVDLLDCGLDHLIQYRIVEIDNTTHFQRVKASFLPAKNKTYRFQLANLPYAHKQYEVRVLIKSKKAVKREFWSDFSYIVFYTANEESKKPSETMTGALAKSDLSKDGFILDGCKVHLTYDAPGKTFVALKWLIDSELQDGIITGYNITYCPIVQTSSNCDKSFNNSYKFISNSKQMQVKIENLFSFKTYKFSLALNTIYGQKPIDNATVFITTSEDTPTNPVNISISDIKNTSLVISWDPPIHKNGIIGKYVIYNYDKEIYVDNVSGTDISHREVTITGLQSFSNYSLTVQACNIALGLCSKLRSSDSVTVTTKIGTPSTLRAPTVKTNPNKLYWKPPQSPGGRVDLYEIQRIKDDSVPEIISTTELSYALDYCVGVVSSETYQVRAVNLYGTEFIDGNYESTAYVGPWSEPSTVVCRNNIW